MAASQADWLKQRGLLKVIPVVDYSSLRSDAGLQALDDACRTWGAWQLVGHPLESVSSDGLHSVMRKFFALPQAEKYKVMRNQENHWGFYDQERTKNKLDLKEIYDYGPADGEQLKPQWPEQPPNFQQTVETFYSACLEIALTTLKAVSANLGTPMEQLTTHFQPRHTSFVRLNYYPQQHAQIAAESRLGISPHTDAGALTVLLQDEVVGLELWRDERWQQVTPLPGALLINLGDIMQVWSNDQYRAPLHRVVANKDRDRYSAPFFFNPSYDTDYQPLLSAQSSTNPAQYRSINWGDFRSGRALGDYADYGEEIQISHFRL
jgi:isopenicillin N synthase-like dioxygenase